MGGMPTPSPAAAPGSPEGDPGLAGRLCHRVKNDLQAAAGILSLARFSAASPEALVAAVTPRLVALAVPYTLVSRHGLPIRLDRLAGELLRRMTAESGGPAAGAEGGLPAWPLALRTATPLALWLSEILDNARRHGGPEGRPALSGARQGGELVIQVADEGPACPRVSTWLPGRAGPAVGPGGGRERLRGRLELAPRAPRGLTVSLRLPAARFDRLNQAPWA